jgi:thioredoxin 1
MPNQNVKEFSAANWDEEVLKSDKPVVVDFWASWCGPCRMLGPTIDKIADQFAGRVKVGKLNVDDHQEIAAKYGITSIPRVYVFKGSDQPREQLVGVRSENELVSVINRVLAS